MALGEDDDDEVRYHGLYEGVVTNNKDPLGLGRVRLRVPGLVENSGWALPRGNTGGGTAQRGFYDPPDKNAEVFVQFIMGDTDRPAFEPGHWGNPDNEDEVPTPVKAVTPKTDRPQVKAYETARYLLEFDHRGGNEKLTIKDKETGAFFQLLPGKILISHGTLIDLGAATDFVTKGTSYRAAEDTMLSGLSAAFGLLVTASTGPLAALAPGFTAAKAAVDVFISAASGAAGFLSAKVRTE